MKSHEVQQINEIVLFWKIHETVAILEIKKNQEMQGTKKAQTLWNIKNIERSKKFQISRQSWEITKQIRKQITPENQENLETLSHT